MADVGSGGGAGTPLSASPMTPAIAAEFVTALTTGKANDFLNKYRLLHEGPAGSSSPNWIAIAKLICSTADMICPIIKNL